MINALRHQRLVHSKFSAIASPKLASDQRLTASKVSTHFLHCPIVVSDFRDQRLTASKVSTLFDFEQPKMPKFVINALRHQRLVHAAYRGFIPPRSIVINALRHQRLVHDREIQRFSIERSDQRLTASKVSTLI